MEIKGFARQLDVLLLGDVTDFGADCLRHVARPLFFGIDRYDPQRARPTLSAVSLGFKKLQRRPASKGWISAADLISALAMGTHWDITAIDQIKPTATTTAIPIPMRICSPSVRIELSDIGLAYFSAPQCEAMHSDRNIPSGSEPRPCSPRRRQRAKGVTVTASAPQGHGFSSMKPISARYRAEMGKTANSPCVAYSSDAAAVEPPHYLLPGPVVTSLCGKLASLRSRPSVHPNCLPSSEDSIERDSRSPLPFDFARTRGTWWLGRATWPAPRIESLSS